MDYRTITRSIVRIKIGTATDEDRRTINDWLDEKKANHQLYKDITHYKSICRRLITESELRDNIDLEAVRTKILVDIARRRQVRRRAVGWGVAAACMVGVISTALLTRTPGEDMSAAQAINIEGVWQAMLILPSGDRVDLPDNGGESIRLSDGMAVGNDSLFMYGDDNTDGPMDAGRNKIVTNTGGSYSFIMNDGTRVWMNSQSEILYPVRFDDDQRVVELTGEAYFEVAPDVERPFVVKINEMQVEVLGTSFNISAYRDEPTIRTSLVSGRVEVSGTGNNPQKVMLDPGMQSVWVRGTGQLYSHAAEMEDIVGWKSGEYIFRKTTLDVILRSLSRWYAVKFENQAVNLSEYTFSGKVTKGDLLLNTLEAFTLAGGPQFVVKNDNTILIMSK